MEEFTIAYIMHPHYNY